MWFKQQKDFPVLVLDAEKLDFVGEKSDYEQIINAIFSQKYHVGLNRLIF